VSRVERNRRLGHAFEKAVRRKPLARRTRALCKLNGEGEVLKLTGVGTEVEEGPTSLRERESVVEGGAREGASRERVRGRADGSGAR
jgi:hypothetical protein